jgi:thioesterase domain-containing protein
MKPLQIEPTHDRPSETVADILPARGQAPELDIWSAAAKLLTLQTQLPPIPRAAGRGPSPLSFAQERLWELERSEPGAPYYHVPLSWEITGKVDVAALERSLDFLVQRHEALRTTFIGTQHGPVQQVNDWHLKLQVIELKAASGEDGRARAIDQARQFLYEPFDLGTGPLLRVALYRWSPRDSLLVWIVHQANFDGGSMRIIGRELGECYRAFSSGDMLDLPMLPVKYSEFACWQRDSLKGDALAQTTGFWAHQLSKPYPSLPLATDYPRQDTGISPGAQVPVVLPKPLRDDLRRLSFAEGTTPFAALVASFHAVLSLYTGQEDILNLASIAARTRPELRNLVGLVSNVVPLRLDLSGRPTFRQLVQRAKHVVSAAFAHQMLPLSRILEMLRTSDSSNENPLLQVAVIYSATPVPNLEIGGVTFTPSPAVENGTAKLDLQLELADGPEGIAGQMKYRSDLFKRATIERLVCDWRRFLELAIEQPDTPFHRLNTGTCVALPAGEHSASLTPRSRRMPHLAGTPLEQTLTRVWEQAFRVHPIGIHDNFFGLGGHSLLGTRIIAGIQEATGRKLRLSTIFGEPTIARLAAAMQEDPPVSGSSIVEIQPHGKRPPLFLVHGVGGGMFWGYSNLARHLEMDQPVYAFKSRGMDGLEEFTRIEDMAAHYVQDLRRFQPAGPYYLGGYCFGGNVAFEMARQLTAQQQEVALLLLMNCWPNNSSYTRLSWTPLFFAKALWNFGVRLRHQLRFGAKRPRDYFKWRTAWVYKRLKALVTRKVEDRVAVEDIVDLSQQTAAERQLWRTHVRAWLQYQPQPYSGRILLLRTRGHPLICSFDHQMGWGSLAAGGVDVRICPGDHESILEEENVAYTATQLQAVLRETQRIYDLRSTTYEPSPGKDPAS